MPDQKPLSDNQIDDLLQQAREVLGTAPGETLQGRTAIETARKSLLLISLGLIKASVNSERRADELPD